jgi:hypothetical protein
VQSIFSLKTHGTYSPEVTPGIIFPCYPLESHAFAKLSIHKALTKFSKLTTKFQTKLSSLQTKGNCFALVPNPQSYHNANENKLPPFHSWTSSFISQLSTLHSLSRILSTSHFTYYTPLTPFNLSILYTPASLDSAGFHNYQHYAISSYIIHLICSICLAAHGYNVYHSAGNRAPI